ncbi:MAG TPA: DoxX family protein [Salinimicrobium sp.]|nr:DoxX family protein [Salinimicrobium sp.]
MKKIFKIYPASGKIDMALLIGRIGIAALMLVHGIPKLQMLLAGEIQFVGVLGMTPEISLVLAVLAEVICSIFILFGLGTRLAAIPLIITMLIAIFNIHSADPFAVKELAVHYLLLYSMLLLMGSGKYSLDAVLLKEKAE